MVRAVPGHRRALRLVWAVSGYPQVVWMARAKLGDLRSRQA
jgi:hypothetical protein